MANAIYQYEVAAAFGDAWVQHPRAPVVQPLAVRGTEGLSVSRDQSHLAVCDSKNDGRVLHCDVNPASPTYLQCTLVLTHEQGLKEPHGVVFDAQGNVYVADHKRNKVLKYNAGGTHMLTIGQDPPVGGDFASPGVFDGPVSVAVTAQGDILVADEGNNRVQRFSAQGQFLNIIGSRVTTLGQSEDGRFEQPSDVRVHTDDSIFVVDRHGLQKFTPAGAFVTRFQLDPEENPICVAVSRADGRVYVSCLDAGVGVHGAEGIYIFSNDGAPWGKVTAQENGQDAFVGMVLNGIDVTDDGHIFIGVYPMDGVDGQARVLKLRPPLQPLAGKGKKAPAKSKAKGGKLREKSAGKGKVVARNGRPGKAATAKKKRGT